MTLYYIFRDRIPFFLSIIWLYRWRLSQRDFLGIPLTEIFRDRIPFFLSIIWLYRWRLSQRDFLGIPLTELLGYYLITVTVILMMIVTGLFGSGQSLVSLVGFKWSFPSPLTWGFLILAGTANLMKKGGGGLFSQSLNRFISAL
jgi:hypothetical protein